LFHEAVILAGGFGTRLSHVVSDVPKPMAPVYGKPFLTYLLDRLIDAGMYRVILATGYKHACIESYFGASYRGAEIIYSQETTPLFTGGAIRQAADYVTGDDFVVLNGDTLFDIDFRKLYDFHVQHHANLSIALRQVNDTSRYGSVTCSNNNIIAFNEKAESVGAGDINGGIYAINRDWLIRQNLPTKFSFEKELMQPMAGDPSFYGLRFTDYFIDIGVPEDYYRAQEEFKTLFPEDEFLFLDRDGILNKHLPGDYVRNWSMWEWIPGVLEAMPALAKKYRRIFIVSNQQGVGKGLMTQADLDDVHRHMLSDIEAAGGRIDRVYVCTDLETAHSPNRKPEIGMALQAKIDFPEVDFHRSVMVGDSKSDELFAQRSGMRFIESIPALGLER